MRRPNRRPLITCSSQHVSALRSSARPGTIVEDVQIPFGRPRETSVKQKREFHDLQQYLLGSLRRAPGHGQVRVSV